jgi:hypothetical protein
MWPPLQRVEATCKFYAGTESIFLEQHPPAVQAGISDHVWTVEEVAKLVD